MSHPQPPQRQPAPDETQRYANALHNTAIFALVACPALALLPPRKLDFFTFGLGGATVYSANFLIREHSGRSVWQHISRTKQQPVPPSSLEHNSFVSPTEKANLYRGLQHASQEKGRLQPEKKESVTELVKDQREAWKVQREKEIRDDIEEGKGFGEMITDQIWEVWNWGKPRDDEDEGG